MPQTSTRPVDRRPAVAPDRDLTHPLDRLKWAIRRFVAYDVVLFVGLFLSLWFWLGVGVDYGLFKAFGVDVAQQLTPALRYGATIALAVTLVALVIWRVTVLVNKEFSFSALALVLEKRHPKLLGDRLITAIQMFDVEHAREQGYSADLVRHTIREARERMTQVNVGSVFNWGRLWLKAGLILAVWAVAVATGLAVHAVASGGFDAVRAAKKTADVCGIFAERNFLFQPTPWPRRAHVEVTDFDDEGHPNEVRIGKGSATPPKVQARVVKWVVADDPWKNADGWRAATVADLKAFGIAESRPELIVDPAFVWPLKATAAGPTVGERVLAGAAELPAATGDVAAAWAAARKVYEAVEVDAAGIDPKAVGEVKLLAELDVLKKRLADSAAVDGRPEQVGRFAALEQQMSQKATAADKLTALRGYAKDEKERLQAQIAALASVRVGLAPDRRLDDIEKEWDDKGSVASRKLAEAKAAAEGTEDTPVRKAAQFQARYLGEVTAFTADVLEAVGRQADAPANSRKLRKLEVPPTLKMRVEGLQTRSRNFVDLVPDAGGKYAAEVANLSETVRFSISAEDFVTARRQITLVPPPAMVDLFRDEYQPAYLHYAAPILSEQERQELPGGDPLFALRGRTHKLAGRKVNISSDRSTFSTPVGTELHLTAEADKDLKSIEIRPVGANPLAVPEFLRAEAKEETRDEKGVITSDRFVELPITRSEKAVETRLETDRVKPKDDKEAKGLRVAEADFQGRKLGVRRFTLKFEGKRAIRQLDKPTEFQLVMTDTDNVTSVRTIAVTAADDAPPQVEVLVDPVVRKVGGQYMITPIARVPFLSDSKVWDNEGLSVVRFEFKKSAEEVQSLVALRAMAAAAVTAQSLAPTASWAMPATVVHSQTQFDLMFGSTVPQTDPAGNLRLPGIEVERYAGEARAMQRLTLDQLAEATVPRDGSDWLEWQLVGELLAKGKWKGEAKAVPAVGRALPGIAGGAADLHLLAVGMVGDKAGADRARAAVLAQKRANTTGDTRADRGPQAVKAIKLSDPKGDAFDLQRFMPELLMTPTESVQKRYKVELFVAAKDVNAELTGRDGQPAEPRSARNLDPIRLLVVSEQDLLIEIGKDEEMQGQRMDDAMTKATGGKSKLDREFSLLRTLPVLAAKEKNDQMLSSQVRMTDIGQDLGKVRELLTAMKTEYEKLYREMDVNRFAAVNMYKYRNEVGTAEERQTGYLDLLTQLLDENKAMSKAEKSVEAVRSALAAQQAPADAALTQATVDYVNLMRLLNRLFDQIGIGNDINKQRAALKEIIDRQKELGEAIGLEKKYREDELKRPSIVLPKQVPTVKANGTVKVKVGVRWKLYPETSLFVGAEAPAASDLKLPKELIVKAKGDEDVTEVELEVTAGAKAGVHTITLRPGTFKPVELQVEVTK